MNGKFQHAVFALAMMPLLARPAAWQTSDHTLALMNGTNIVWQIVADPAQGKPYFHPLATPDGTVLTDLHPKDHPWHLGLWFSWKFINGLNYWEYDATTHREQAATELTASKLDPHDDGSASLSFDLSYHPWNAAPVMTEKRTVEISAPANGSYALRWTSEFTAATNVALTRTPPPGEADGKPWGGYAGLSLRLHPATRNWTFVNSDGASGEKALHGKPARWMKFSAGSGRAAITIFDDEQNARHPSPWYVAQGMPYFSPAPLFQQTMNLNPGDKLTLRYRIVITDRDDKAGTP